MKIDAYSSNQINTNYLKNFKPSFGFKVRLDEGTDEVALAVDTPMTSTQKKYFENMKMIDKIKKEIASYEFKGIKAPQTLLAELARLTKNI